MSGEEKVEGDLQEEKENLQEEDTPQSIHDYTIDRVGEQLSAITEADFAIDYVKIKNFALQAKRIKAIEKWKNEKIAETYIKLNGDYRTCDYSSNWIKQ